MTLEKMHISESTLLDEVQESSSSYAYAADPLKDP
jgi:hypothetical protein